MIFNLVEEWGAKAKGLGVQYVAHAITAAGVATCLGESLAGGGMEPKTHPDQEYWRKVKSPDDAGIDLAAIARIEIDCTLLPCAGGNDGCLLIVPFLVQQAGFGDLPLRIFSHRYEGGDISKPKRYFDCRSASPRGELKRLFAVNGSWDWAAP
ncbi:hypothetical protein [Paraburkholderia dioscoreae]|uniref:hypothetical protein n=1 Tax=Paraburkholderia dioscoreae TaxID=2604047 RepID=UPI0013EB016C|nr:hypothetical protein [Paraburkholderia dioscoreae]